jgi:hypothetical protein
MFPLFLSDFNETWILSTDFRKNQISNFMKIRQVGAELFQADGRTDMIKLTVAFRKFAKAPENSGYFTHRCSAPCNKSCRRPWSVTHLLTYKIHDLSVERHPNRIKRHLSHDSTRCVSFWLYWIKFLPLHVLVALTEFFKLSVWKHLLLI